MFQQATRPVRYGHGWGGDTNALPANRHQQAGARAIERFVLLALRALYIDVLAFVEECAGRSGLNMMARQQLLSTWGPANQAAFATGKIRWLGERTRRVSDNTPHPLNAASRNPIEFAGPPDPAPFRKVLLFSFVKTNDTL